MIAQGSPPVRFLEWTEREIHPARDIPSGDGWVFVSSDGIDSIWERKRVTRTYEY